MKGLFQGYRNENSLSDLEINSVPQIMLAIQMIFMAYFIEYPAIFEINKVMFFGYIEISIKYNEDGVNLK